LLDVCGGALFVSPEAVIALRAYRPVAVAVGTFTAVRPGETETTLLPFDDFTIKARSQAPSPKKTLDVKSSRCR
jgi:hypothetical protein